PLARNRGAGRSQAKLAGTMRALVKSEAAPGLELKEVPEPQAGPGEVVLKILRTGICGTDLHIYDWDHWSQETIQPPLIVGHEFVGEVLEVGPGAEAYHVG